MRYQLSIPVASASLLVASAAFAGAHGHANAHARGVMPVLAPHSAPHSVTITGRIVAVRRVSQVITVQTGTGEMREVKVPANATITSHSGNHFSSVRAGQDVNVKTVGDSGRGIAAQSVAVR